MNNSGEAVVEFVNFYKEPLEHVIIIYDDMDTEIGKIRVRAKGLGGSEFHIVSTNQGHYGVDEGIAVPEPAQHLFGLLCANFGMTIKMVIAVFIGGFAFRLADIMQQQSHANISICPFIREPVMAFCVG